MAWLPEWTDAWKMLCFGTALGYIVFWRETVGVSTSIASPVLLDSFGCSRLDIARCPRDVSGRAARFYLLLWIRKAIKAPESPAERVINTCKCLRSMISGTSRVYSASNFLAQCPKLSPLAGTLEAMSMLLDCTTARCRWCLSHSICSFADSSH